ncbi:hypothetical protein C8J56DRAFT_1173589 [Mycena floridula]|nr:hypothetical protein C8J56DRAFT_1173589 [Mycena floridula]
MNQLHPVQLRGDPEPCSVCHFDASIEPELHVRAPDVQKLLASDEAPRGLQLQELSARLTSAVDDLVAAELEMERLSQELLALAQKSHRLKADIVDLRAIIHPIRRIPAEILFEIFVQSDDSEEPHHLDISQYPWTLTHVCRRWRNVAIGNPSLWTDIHIEPGSRYSSPIIQSRAKLLGVQLFRSRSLPLNVTIINISRNGYHSTFLTLLLPTSPRWKSLSLEILSDMLKDFTDITGCLDSLETLDLSFQPSISSTGIDGIDAFRYMPRIKTLRAEPGLLQHLGPAMGCVETWQVPWEDADEILAAFCHVPRIKACEVQLGWTDSEFEASPILLAHLERLEIVGTNKVGYEDILDHIVVPCLQHLKLSTGPLNLDSLESFVKRSSLRLHSLCVTTISVDGSRLFAMFPELTSLTIERNDEDDDNDDGDGDGDGDDNNNDDDDDDDDDDNNNDDDSDSRSDSHTELIALLASPASAILIPNLQHLSFHIDRKASMDSMLEKYLDEIAQLRPQLRLEVIRS